MFSKIASQKIIKAAAAVCTALACTLAPVTASAQSTLPPEGFNEPWRGNTPHVVSKTHIAGNHWKLKVWSPANRRVVTNNVLVAAGNAPRGSLYLLPGIQGGLRGLNWMTHTDVARWSANKNVNIVMPLGGNSSLYTDWNSYDPILGTNKWNTYMTRELPPIIDKTFHGNGRDAIAGLSSTGGAALDIAGDDKKRFKAAASFSGCPVRSGPLGGTVSAALMAYGGGSSQNAWGLPGHPDWIKHDPAAHPGELRGTKVFIGSATGKPGAIDRTNSPGQYFGPSQIEALFNECSNQYTRKARAAGVDVHRYISPTGSHSFGLFEHQLKLSWNTTIKPAIG